MLKKAAPVTVGAAFFGNDAKNGWCRIRSNDQNCSIWYVPDFGCLLSKDRDCR